MSLGLQTPVVAIVRHDRHAFGQVVHVHRVIERVKALLLAEVSRSVRDRTVSAVDVAYEKQRGPHTRKDIMEARATHLGS